MRIDKTLGFLVTAVLFFFGAPASPAASRARSNEPGAPGQVVKKGINLDIRSSARLVMDQITANRGVLAISPTSPLPGQSVVPPIQFRGGNVQVNDPGQDHVDLIPGLAPLVFSTESETSIAAHGSNLVATYNSSAGSRILPDPSGSGLVVDHLLFSAFSASADGGRTWTSGFFPPLRGSRFTLGDPSVVVDRLGNFHFAGAGLDAASGAFTIQTNKSRDGGLHWSDAVLVSQDDGADKPWLAIGPDPVENSRDNLYVTWTRFFSFPVFGSELRLGRSTDGGETWVTNTIFSPPLAPDPANPTTIVGLTNPYVDPITGRLYVPFVHFGFGDRDYIRILFSDDGGETFSFVKFRAPGAPDGTLLPFVEPGELTDCGTFGGFTLTLHSGTNIGGGRFGLPRYIHSSRIIMQPAFAARNGVLFLAWSASTSPFFGDPEAGSDILFSRSEDGGTVWTVPVQASPAAAMDTHHVLPSLTIDEDPNDVHITYYTQHHDGSVDVDVANSRDRGASFPSSRALRVTGAPFSLPPTNIPTPTRKDPFLTANYDALFAPCYGLGEYVNSTAANGTLYLLWGDARNPITEPVHSLDPLSGQTHPQQDVFFQALKAQ